MFEELDLKIDASTQGESQIYTSSQVYLCNTVQKACIPTAVMVKTKCQNPTA